MDSTDRHGGPSCAGDNGLHATPLGESCDDLVHDALSWV
jgi:hypothetical protein